jgi:hypothetical protein
MLEAVLERVAYDPLALFMIVAAVLVFFMFRTTT